VLDLCTGSGCIPILLCASWNPGSAFALGIDTSKEALQLARDNALSHASVVTLTSHRRHPHGLTGSAAPTSRANTTKNLFLPLHGDVRDTPKLIELLSPWRPFDVITANPPYIPRDQYAQLDRSVRQFEDPGALLGDPLGAPDSHGLTFYWDIARLVSQGHILSADGWLVLEVGDGQARTVENIVRSTARMENTEIWVDQWGKERVVVARYDK
jgi:release factor glutamine methyltransferase